MKKLVVVHITPEAERIVNRFGGEVAKNVECRPRGWISVVSIPKPLEEMGLEIVGDPAWGQTIRPRRGG